MKKYLIKIFVFIILGFSCKKKALNQFDLSSFPKEWVILTEKDGNLVIFNSCDNGNLLLSIVSNKGQYELLLHGQQEDEDFIIIETTQVNDTFLFKTKSNVTDEIQNIKFIWNDKKKGIGRFITLYSNGNSSNNLFVLKEKQSQFEIINQSCKECWGDECDELKPTIDLMQGVWYHDKDSLSSININQTNFIFKYDGKKSKHNDTFTINISDKLIQYNEAYPNVEYLILANKSDTLNFEILGLSDSTLSLMYYPSLKIHVYRRNK